MQVREDVRIVLRDTLQLGDRAESITDDTGLLGNIPELDSMAVAQLIAAIEEHFDIFIEDDEISAETFETFGSLHKFVGSKVAA